MKNKSVQHIQKNKKAILAAWLKSLSEGTRDYQQIATEEELQTEAENFLNEFTFSISSGSTEVRSKEYDTLRSMISEIAKVRSSMGYRAKETALFILDLKNTLMFFLKDLYDENPTLLLTELRVINSIIDELSTITFETFIREKEAVIQRQRAELLEASTPVIKLWEGILGVPIIGTIDSQRSQQIMDTLLNSIMRTGYEVAIIDISGVSTLDTLTAQHILKTTAAARLMGATCIISGVSSVIAQTIVSLDIDLGITRTKSTMSEAIKEALYIIREKPINYLEDGKNTHFESGKPTIGHHSD